MRFVGSLALFVVCIAFANASVWVGALGIARLPSGLDVLVVIGTPVALFLVPGLLLRWVKKRAQRRAAAERGAPAGAEATSRSPVAREGQTGPSSKPAEPTIEDGSLLGAWAVSFIIFGILCPLSMFFVGPATYGWVDLLSGQVVESATVDDVLAEPDAVYVSLAGAQVRGELVGESKYRVGRGDYTYYYAVPIVAAAPTGKAAAAAAKTATGVGSAKTKESFEPQVDPLGTTGAGPAYRLWLGTTDQRQLAGINGRSVFGGRVQRHGGDYAEAIDDAVRRHDLGAMDDPIVIELGAPTYREALEETQLWAWLGLGIFNLLFVALAGFGAFARRGEQQPEAQIH